LKHGGTEEAEEIWAGGPPERQDGIAAGTANLLPQISTDEHRSKAELLPLISVAAEQIQMMISAAAD
jgi:hypothetical protein